MKLFDLLEEVDTDIRDRDKIREYMIRDIAEEGGELSNKELDVIAQGGPLWELSLDDVDDEDEAKTIYERFKFRFAYIDSDSGICRVYSSSKQKLDNFLISYYRYSSRDINELENDNYLIKIR